jgi:hypothetical protein
MTPNAAGRTKDIVPEQQFHDWPSWTAHSLRGAFIGLALGLGFLAPVMRNPVLAIGALLYAALLGAIIMGNWWNCLNRHLW